MTRFRRPLSLLLTLLLLLSLAPAALAEGEEDGSTAVESVALSQNSITMNLDSGGMSLNAIITPEDLGQIVLWRIADESVVTSNDSRSTTVQLTPRRPGETTITATVEGKESLPCKITVSGLYFANQTDTEIEMYASESRDLPIPSRFGGAQNGTLEWSSDAPRIADYSANKIVAYAAGKAVFTAKANGYSASITVNVLSSDAEDIKEKAGTGSPLSFQTAGMESKLGQRSTAVTKSGLKYVTGLYVSPSEGTLYLGYRSEAEPGAGVAQMVSYYTRSARVGPYIEDITFVPSPSFQGPTATIRYSGVSENNRNFSGRILVDVDTTNANVSLDATVQDPAKFTGQLFSRVCQSRLGEALKEVVFTTPAETRGTLYLDYSSTSDYGSRVETDRRYRLSELDRISFVPAPGFAGTVTIPYTGYGVSGGSYRGEITVTVTQDDTAGPVYNTGKNSPVTFDGGDFDDYCATRTGRTLRQVQFTLPPASQGALYYDYNSSTAAGTPVSAGSYYFLSQTPRISHVTFVPAPEFTGRVEIPFTGWDNNGNRFSGTAEVNVKAAGGSGDVYYVCGPGKSVKIDREDFNDLSMDLTGRRLRYLSFNGLPSSSDGTLYHSRTSSSSGTRVTRDKKYGYSSTPYINNLSFWAANSFSGSVQVPFTGTNIDGDTFTGTMVIDSRNSSGGSTGSRSEIVYDTDYREPVDFVARDFDDLCLYETGDDLNYVTFTQPSSREGTLYDYYRASGSGNTKVGSSTRYYYSGSGHTISDVTFVPANSFEGTALVDFTGYARDGSRFKGTVEINVGQSAPAAQVIYTTRQSPVNLQVSAFESANSRYRLRSVRFSYMPPESAGRLYFRYASPTSYGWQATANTEYMASGSPSLSSLTFVPRAGYSGSVTIPYTATTTTGTQYAGELIIYVESGGSSSYFTDMAGYSYEAQAAVDYLRDQGVTSGVTATTYGPELSIRRGDFALMLVRAFKLTANGGTGQRFADVPATAYYADAVQTLRALGVVTGTGSNLYQPGATLSRQDAMLMVQRAMRLSGWSAGDGPAYMLSSYADSGSVSAYAQGAMAYMVQQGLLPTRGGLLAPRDALSRVDMALLLHRAMTM